MFMCRVSLDQMIANAKAYKPGRSFKQRLNMLVNTAVKAA